MTPPRPSRGRRARGAAAEGKNPEKPMIVLALQGGGGLGAYHIGAYQALAEAGFEPDWIAGISIGAINGALIAGNPPGDRLARLEAFWRDITWPAWATMPAFPTAIADPASYAEALFLGQPNFFVPRPVNPFFAPSGAPSATSFYDTSPLRQTLLRLVDFSRLGAGAPRFTVGATDVATGDLAFFDSRALALGVEHVLASASLPPAFPATRIDAASYWDGGTVANTPLDAVLDTLPVNPMLVFVLDLWRGRGRVPQDMREVLWRIKEIRYASRTRVQISAIATRLNHRRAMDLLRGAAGPGPTLPTGQLAAGRVDIVHLIYAASAAGIPENDAEFSPLQIAKRRQAGYADMQAALAAAPWRAAPWPTHVAARIHRFEAGAVETLPDPLL